MLLLLRCCCRCCRCIFFFFLVLLFSFMVAHIGNATSAGSRSRAYQNILDDPPFDSPFSAGETA
jgi:hypothetical protein